MKETISWHDFEKVDLRVGTIIEADHFPEARQPAYRLTIDFGPMGTRRSSAQITKNYQLDQLIGRQIIAVVNFPSKQIANMMSECLVLGVVGQDNDIVLLTPDTETENGLAIG